MEIYVCIYIPIYTYIYIYNRVSTIQERAGFLPQFFSVSPAHRQVLSLAPERFRERIQWMPFKERATVAIENGSFIVDLMGKP